MKLVYREPCTVVLWNYVFHLAKIQLRSLDDLKIFRSSETDHEVRAYVAFKDAKPHDSGLSGEKSSESPLFGPKQDATRNTETKCPFQ